MVTDFWRELAKIGIPYVHSVRWFQRPLTALTDIFEPSHMMFI